jgi:hypothetical protein
MADRYRIVHVSAGTWSVEVLRKSKWELLREPPVYGGLWAYKGQPYIFPSEQAAEKVIDNLTAKLNPPREYPPQMASNTL